MERFDDPVLALLLTYNGRLPSGDLPDESTVASRVATSAYAQRLIQLAEWVGDGKEITAKGVLRPVVAGDAYVALGLGDWQLDLLRREYPDERLPGVARVGRDAWIAKEMEQKWRSAADCEELHRLWVGAVGCELIVLDGRRARFSGEPAPDAERWVDIGVRSALSMADHVDDYRLALLAVALMESYVARCAPVTKQAILDFLLGWNWPADLQQEMDEFDEGWREKHTTGRPWSRPSGCGRTRGSTSRTRTPSPSRRSVTSSSAPGART